MSATEKASEAATSASDAAGYKAQCEAIVAGLSGALIPMGTVAFENLPALADCKNGYMYNINNEFTTTSDFVEGAGHVYPVGTNVYKIAPGKWDCLAGINLSPDKIGAVASSGGEVADTVATFTSNDCGEDGDAAQLTVAKLTSGETLKSMMNKVSRMFTNVRYILRLLGNTDISSESVKIGDGTITGALSALNSNWSKIGTAAIEVLSGTVPVPNSTWTSVCIYYNLQPGTYLLIAQMSSKKSIQYARLCKGLDVDSILSNTPYGSGTLFCILTLTEITTVSLWVYQNAESPMNFNEREASIISVRIK